MIKDKVIEYVVKISSQPKSAQASEDLSNEFLVIKSQLADALEDAERMASLRKGDEKATFSQAVLDVPKDEKGKDPSNAAKEHIATVNADYQKAIVDRGASDAYVNWLKTHIDIFSDAIITFRKRAERLSR